MDTWMWIVGSIIGALFGAIAFLVWAVFRCGEEPDTHWFHGTDPL